MSVNTDVCQSCGTTLEQFATLKFGKVVMIKGCPNCGENADHKVTPQKAGFGDF